MTEVVDRAGASATGMATGSEAEMREAAAREAPSHSRLIRSRRDGRILSALMLPFLWLSPPPAYGVLTTTGRRTGKRRRKCVRVVRRGDRAYLLMMRPPSVAIQNPTSVSAWLLNIRANPAVELRLPGGSFKGRAYELSEPTEIELAREGLCETVSWLDYGESSVHLRGLPTRAKIEKLHAYWFTTGIPIGVELEV